MLLAMGQSVLTPCFLSDLNAVGLYDILQAVVACSSKTWTHHTVDTLLVVVVLQTYVREVNRYGRTCFYCSNHFLMLLLFL
jgi:hypothetical protein